jgi:hypothetical protein
MMSMAPPLSLTQEQARRLLAYIQAYRRALLTQLAPSTERNANQRLLQALQGKLMQEMDRLEQERSLSFDLTHEEQRIVKQLAADLLLLRAREQASPERDAALVDLAQLKATVERLYGLGSSPRARLEKVWTGERA